MIQLPKKEDELALNREMIGEVESISITTQDQSVNAGALLVKIKERIKSLEDDRTKLKEPVLKLGKEIDSFFKEIKEPLENASKHLSNAIQSYILEQQRLQAEAERKMLEEKAKRDAEERLKLEAKAMKAEQKGKVELAEELREQAESVNTLAMPNTITYTTKINNIHTKKKVVAVINDFNKIPTSFYINDPKVQDAIQAVINKYAPMRTPIDGVEYREESSVVVRVK